MEMCPLDYLHDALSGKIGIQPAWSFQDDVPDRNQYLHVQTDNKNDYRARLYFSQ